MRKLITGALFTLLRLYTRYVPFHRGRGAMIRPLEWLKRRGWEAPVTPLGGGLVMELEPSLLGWTVFEEGVWEEAQTRIVRELLRPGDVVLNVGANTGYYTLIAAAAVGPHGAVHAFEIQPAMTAILRRNIARNRLTNITVVESGCFSREGEAFIHKPGDPGSARIAFAGEGVRVPLTTIDRYAAALPRVDVILIDTEGADLDVLKGATGVLERCHPAVLAEAHHLEAFGGSEAELRALMLRFGYTVRELTSRFSRDLLFLPPRRA
ncbi:MAG TPA: FkbM family methyltransferase [Thermoanaerobaculia bacterium]